jgi:hypothetical protein
LLPSLESYRLCTHLMRPARHAPITQQVPGMMPGPLDRYVAALYWSVMTLTSIGYGEMTPLNTTERVLCSIYMLLSGMMWTYVIGTVAAIATTLNPNQILYEQTMDQLNYFMRERQLPYAMRMTLRDFFQLSRRVNQLNDDADLLDKMSPLLQGAVALAANQMWIDQIWFLRGLSKTRAGLEFIASLAKSLVLRNFVAKERLPIGQLYILRRGMCVKMWRFLGNKTVWGEDVIIDNQELIDHAQAVALTCARPHSERDRISAPRAPRAPRLSLPCTLYMPRHGHHLHAHTLQSPPQLRRGLHASPFVPRHSPR